MKRNILRITVIITIVIAIASCRAHQSVPYLKDAKTEKFESSKSSEARICVNDQLTIIVNTTTQDAAAAFNLTTTPPQLSGTSVGYGQSIQTYLVNSDGSIDYPIIGKIQVAGKTKREVELLIKDKIYPTYLKEEPIVNIRFTNFKVSVLGEVNRPGSFNVTNEKITILEALAMAGDMTLYGKRDNVLLIRENDNGSKETVRLNLQDKNLLDSPYFYLKQNDVLYVQPNNPKANASAISTGETLLVSITSVLISLSSLVVTILR